MDTECSDSTYSRTEFIDDIGNVVLGMKVNVSGSVGLACAETARHLIELHLDRRSPPVVPELTNEVLAEIGHVSHRSDVRVKHQSVAVRVGLAGGNGRLVVVGVIDATVLLGRRDHASALLGIVDGMDRACEVTGLLVKRNDRQCRVPVVDGEYVPLGPVDGEVACGGATGIDRSHELERAIRSHLVGKNPAVLFNILCACVHNIQSRMDTGEGRIDNVGGLSGLVDKHHRSVRRVELEYVDAMFGLRAAGPMSYSRVDPIRVK